MLDWIRSHPTVADESPVGVIESEASIVARAKVDRQAFEPLYARYLDPVYRYCYRRLSNREAAEDATSQVFLKALAALPSYNEGSFRGWLFTIAHNVVVDAYRHRRPEQPLIDPSEQDDIADESPAPEDLALAAEERRSLRTVMARLPADQRSVVELRLAGLTGAEIARAMGRSTGAVKMLQFRAVSRLRELLGNEAGSAGGYEEGHDG